MHEAAAGGASRESASTPLAQSLRAWHASLLCFLSARMCRCVCLFDACRRVIPDTMLAAAAAATARVRAHKQMRTNTCVQCVACARACGLFEVRGRGLKTKPPHNNPKGSCSHHCAGAAAVTPPPPPPADAAHHHCTTTPGKSCGHERREEVCARTRWRRAGGEGGAQRGVVDAPADCASVCAKQRVNKCFRE